MRTPTFLSILSNGMCSLIPPVRSAMLSIHSIMSPTRPITPSAHPTMLPVHPIILSVRPVMLSRRSADPLVLPVSDTTAGANLFQHLPIVLPTFLIVLLLLSSCRREILYERFQVVGTVWYQDTGLTYFYNIPDVSKSYDLTLEIRHNGTYPYRNIWIFSQEERPVGEIYRDTLECELADVEGSWLGRGYSIRTLSVPLRRGHEYPMGGRYILTLFHGMRDEPLVGIESIGLRITYSH